MPRATPRPRAPRPRALALAARTLALAAGALALAACAPPRPAAPPAARRALPSTATPPPPSPLPPSARDAAGVPEPAAKAPPPEPDLPVWPARPADAPSGKAFVRALEAADEQGREAAVLREVCRGNVPGYLRRLVRLEARGETSSGRPRALTFWVTPDYLAVGDDADSVRVPMGAVTAQLVADRLGFVLPTAKLVDLVYRLAPDKLAPRTFPPSAAMVRAEAFAQHDELIDAQLGRGAPAGLVAGHKKDVVVSNRLRERPHRLALYGWHRPDGQPIQPLSTAHGDWYSDYSHGVRLVAPTVLVDGEPRRTLDVLADPELAPLLSDEGPIAQARYRTDEGAGRLAWWPAGPAPKRHAAAARPPPRRGRAPR
ncbi:MAG TPA: hypothetical protein VFS43_22550 [Polyangiaceae bacterium]|nr:hypothetical protein [Polyangiaceae bacterium]